jgi:hypothetical protein
MREGGRNTKQALRWKEPGISAYGKDSVERDG